MSEPVAWYYAYRGRPRGPLLEESFLQLVRSGVITAETLVWQPGWSDWRPLREAWPDAEPPKAAELPPGARCAECGRPTEPHRRVQLDGHPICTECRNLVVQRLRETGRVLESLRFAPFLPRFLAYMLDHLLLALVLYPLSMALVVGLLPARDSEHLSPERMLRIYLVQGGLSLFGLVLNGIYEIWTVGQFGGTLGKLAFRMRVTDSEGRRITHARATGRFFAKLLCQFTCGVGFLLALFDRERRALHDMICNTRVIHI